MSVQALAMLGVKVDPRQAVQGSKLASKAVLGIGKSAKESQKSINKLKSSIAQLGAGMLIYKTLLSSLRYAQFTEDLAVKLTAVYQSTDRANESFEAMLKFSQSVPFTFQEIGRASGSLALVTKNTEELNRVMRMTADISAGAGMSYQVVAGQIQRAFGAGIATVELFREKGVSAMYGFVQGVHYTAKETKRMMMDNKTAFAGASLAMSKTFTGQVSMMGDAWDILLLKFSKTGTFDVVKESVVDLTEFLKTSELHKMVDDFGASFAAWLKGLSLGVKGVGYAIVGLYDGVDKAYTTLKHIINLIPTAIKNADKIANSLTPDLSTITPPKWQKYLPESIEPEQAPSSSITDMVSLNGNSLNSKVLRENLKLLKGMSKEKDKIANTKLFSEWEKAQVDFRKIYKGLDEYEKKNIRAAESLTTSEKNTQRYGDALRKLNKDMTDANLPMAEMVSLREQLAYVGGLVIETIQATKYDELTKSLDEYTDTNVRAAAVFTAVEENALKYSDALKVLNEGITDGNLPMERALKLREKLAASNSLVIETMQATKYDELTQSINEYRQTHVRANKTLSKAEENALNYADALKKLNEDMKDANLPMEKMIALQGKLAEANDLVVQSIEDAELDKLVADMADSMEDSITKSVMNMGKGLESFRDLATSIFRDIAAKMVKTSISKPIAGYLSGVVGNMFDGNYAGGGYTGSGSRSGGVDGEGGFPAILHPQETVIDHNKGQTMGSNTNITVTYSPQVNALDPQTAATVIAENAPLVVGIIRQAFSRGGQSVNI